MAQPLQSHAASLRDIETDERKQPQAPVAGDDDDEEEEDEEEDEDEEPTKGKKKRGDEDDDEDEDDDDEDDGKKKKKSGVSTFWLGVIGLNAVFFCCCCCLPTPFIAYNEYTRPPFVGEWEKADAKGQPEIGLTIRSGNSGLYNYYPDGLDKLDLLTNFTWKTVDHNKIEIVHNDPTRNFWFGANKGTVTWVASADELTLTSAADKKGVRFKKLKK